MPVKRVYITVPQSLYDSQIYQGAEMDYDSLDAKDLAAHFQTMNDIDRREFFAEFGRHLTPQDRAQLLLALLKA